MGELRSTRPWVLAIDPWPRGFAYAFFEGERNLIDWGLRHIDEENRSAVALFRLRRIIETLQPDYLVMEPWDSPECRRTPRVRTFLSMAAQTAQAMGIPTCLVHRHDIAIAFAQPGVRSTKRQVANTISLIHPEVASRLPPRRKTWMGEDPRLSIFTSCALAISYYQSYQRPAACDKNDLTN